MPRDRFPSSQNAQVKSALEPEFDQVAQIVLDWMHAHGFTDAVLADDAGHGAFDVDASKAIAEINIAQPPSRPNVQRLDTVSRNAERPALYFSVRGFTTSAEEWANNVNIALFAFEKDGVTIIPVNPLAEELVANPPTRERELLDAATRAVAAVSKEIQEEQQFAGVDDETRQRIEAARETKRMRRNLFG
jgi:hypothetical protein